MKKSVLILLCCSVVALSNTLWGFYAHKKINRLAVFTLPKAIIGFYKHHITYITENAVNPDRRRNVVKAEPPRHYLDADVYGDSAVYKLPRYWNDAVAAYSEDTLMTYGIVPWHIYRVKKWLTDAMRVQDVAAILRLSADLGHYIGDANVPLHTTENYNGQLTGQHGIHGFWESRLPELFSEEYTFFVGSARYIGNTQLAAWDMVIGAHAALDSVLRFERMLSRRMGDDKKYSFELRGNKMKRVYSRAFSKAYHKMLDGMVERQMRKAIKYIGSYWYTCWVDAGQPDLQNLIDFEFTEEQLQERRQELEAWKQQKYESRNHE